VQSAFEWKQFYAAERDRLGDTWMRRAIEGAPALPPGAALIIPHTRLEVTGRQIAAAARAVVSSGAKAVLALGVLHGGRRADAGMVAAARDGDRAAVTALRGVHTEDAAAAEEFSLDGFTEMVRLAADMAGREVEVVRRYPFLVGTDPGSLPGLADLQALAAGGAQLVATTDPLHHGHAYGSPPDECRPADPSALAWAVSRFQRQLTLVSEGRYAEFQEAVAADRSDFRDTGPVLAELLGAGFTWTVLDFALVDYSAALGAAAPSWVAGGLVSVERPAVSSR
jgi:hypothetical protein